MSEEDIRKIIRDELGKQQKRRIFQDDIIPKAIKQRSIDGTVIIHGLSTDIPINGDAVGIYAWFSTDTGVLSLWNGTAWVTQTVENLTGSAWTTFTPTFTNLTVGDGTVGGRYKKIGRTVDFQCRFIYGTTSAVGSTPTLVFPFTKSSSFNGSGIIGTARYNDTGTGLHGGGLLGGGELITYTSSSSYITEAFLSSTVPFTWATGDGIFIEARYETAS